MIELGNPCNLATSKTNTSTTELVVKGRFRGRRYAYLDNLSTTTSITTNPCELGRPVMKSREISSQTTLRIGRCHGNPNWRHSLIFVMRTYVTLTNVCHDSLFHSFPKEVGRNKLIHLIKT